MLSAGIEGAQVGELAERIIPVTPRLILRVGGSGTSPVIPWNGSTRISSRPIEQQIEYAPSPSCSSDLTFIERRKLQSIRFSVNSRGLSVKLFRAPLN